MLGANVRHREKERAERATLVTQERLVKGKVRARQESCSRRVEPVCFLTSRVSKRVSCLAEICSPCQDDVLRCTSQ